MQFFSNLFNIPESDFVLNYRLILSSFFLLTFIILFYFWYLSKGKAYTGKRDVSGILYLSLAFLMYFIIGFISLKDPGMRIYLLLSGLLNCCYLMALPFLSSRKNWADKILHHHLWKPGVIILCIGWFLFVFTIRRLKLGNDIDIVFSSVSILLLGLLLIQSFIAKGLRLLGIITGVLFVLFILLQYYSPDILGKGRFVHINSIILFPALFLSIITVSFTFSWMNEQTFRELSQLYTDSDSKAAEDRVEQASLSIDALRETWQDQLAKDDMEKVIQGVLAYKKHKNDSLNFIINVAQRNSHNNTNRLKDLIKYEEYQISRARISEALLSLIME